MKIIKTSFIKDIKLRYRIIKSTVTVLIGSFAIAALSTARIALPFNGYIESISPYHTEFVADSRIPENYSEVLFKKPYINYLLNHWNCELNELALLGDDWDGENSAAVQPDAVKICRDILENTSSSIGSLHEIYPTPFGSICMEWSVGKGYVNAEIASTGIAFFHNFGDPAKKYIREFAPVSDEIIEDLKANLS